MVGGQTPTLATDGLIEIKTIGDGQHSVGSPAPDREVRPGLGHALENIKHPFPSHRKQGMLYCHFLERDTIKFIYDPKFVSAAPKEFVVKYNHSIIEDILKECVAINTDVSTARAPNRPDWAEKIPPDLCPLSIPQDTAMLPSLGGILMPRQSKRTPGPKARPPEEVLGQP